MSDGVGIIHQIDAAIVRGIGLAHLGRPVAQAHDPRARSINQGLGQGEEARGGKVIVKLGGNVAGQFEVLLLVLANRHAGGLIDQNIGRLQHGIGVEPDAGAFLVLARLFLELGHAVQPAEPRHAVENPRQFGMGPHRRLGKDRRLFRINARRQIGRRDLARLGGQEGRVLPDRDGV